MKLLKETFTKNIAFVLALYWIVLVLWQNVSLQTSRGGVDVFLKIILLIYFIYNFSIRSKGLFSGFPIVLCITIFFVFSAINEPSLLSVNIIISYLYPSILIFLVYGIGNDFEINKKQLISFCLCVIVTMLYAVLYGVIFFPEKITSAILATGAYGHEYSSFFISSHEYGMYLVFAIISSVVCLKYSSNLTLTKKLIYISIIVIFLLNLIITFSRTSILAFVIFISVYLFYERGQVKRGIVIFFITSLIFILSYPTTHSFIFNVILKGNNLAGRDVLFNNAISYFQSSSYFQFFFGHGITEPQEYFSNKFGHSSVHNGYLQVLLFYGISLFSSLLIFLYLQIKYNYKIIYHNRFIGSVFLAGNLMSIAIMFSNTTMIFNSSIDSYFLTVFSFIVPKYVSNSIMNNNFDN